MAAAGRRRRVRKKPRTHCIGILTSGGDCPGLNAAIRGVAKPALDHYGIEVIGIFDGFRGLVENRTRPLDSRSVSGILTLGGTLLGTSRDRPHRMPMGGKVLDMTETVAANAKRLGIDALVCLGGRGTQKNALHLHEAAGMSVLTLPKTIDNDVAETDVSFGFDTAMAIATEAIDRLHSTATSHNRLIVCEVMGHNAGWLALGAGIAGGADVILIPEIPYDLEVVAEHLKARRRGGKRFSIIVAAEGARTRQEALAESERGEKARGKGKKPAKPARRPLARREASDVRDDPAGGDLEAPTMVREPMASRLARQLQRITGTEARVTSLGHVQRGGTPTAADRLLCTRLGTKAAELLSEGVYNVMVAVRGGRCEPVSLEKVARERKIVPPDHAWVAAARLVGTCFGDL
ncbi:MAG: ATP-dependent 6-phosphofructokinase [Acidobacteriia bacterium]|nr:ATP-dependent 6-phosphofructokinase [Terriglobia bacterium]